IDKRGWLSSAPCQCSRDTRAAARHCQYRRDNSFCKSSCCSFLVGHFRRFAAAGKPGDWDFPNSQKPETHGKYDRNHSDIERTVLILLSPSKIEHGGKCCEYEEDK